MIDWIIHFILTVLKPLIKLIGKLRLPASHRRINQLQVKDYMNTCKVGDIVLSKKDWEPTNLLIKGKYKHAAIVISDAGKLVEAVDPRARMIGFYDFFLHSDEIVVVRPKGFLGFERDDIRRFAVNAIGHKYDYYFNDGNEDYYCSELCYEALKSAKPEWAFKRKDFLGVKTVQPDDFMLATKHFDIVWSSKR